MRTAKGYEPVVVVVANEKHQRMAVGLRGGLEVMGLTVFERPSIAKLAEAPVDFDHILFVGAMDTPHALEPASLPSNEAQEAPNRKHASDYLLHEYPLNTPGDAPDKAAALDLMCRATSAGLTAFDIAAGPGKGFSIIDPSVEKDKQVVGIFEQPSAHSLLETIIGLCGGAGRIGALGANRGMFLLRCVYGIVEIAVELRGESDHYTGATIQLSPISELKQRPEPFETEVTTGEAAIARVVTNIHQQALRHGAHSIIMVPTENGGEITFSVGPYDFDIMTLPANVRDSAIQHLRVMADLWLANRRIVQRGRYEFILGGSVYRPEVTIMPTDHGERVEIMIEPRHDEATAEDLVGNALPPDFSLHGKMLLLLGNDVVDTTLWPRWSARGVRRLIATTEPLDTSTVLLFTLSFYRSIIRQGDERAAFRKAKTSILSGDEIRLYDRELTV